MRRDLKVIYTSYQPYSLKLAVKLKERFSWTPVYWFTDTEIKNELLNCFPDVITHDYIQAIKGIKPDNFSLRNNCPVDEKLLNEMSIYESVAMNMMERNDGNNCFTHSERINLYHYHLKYWLEVFDQLKPDIIIFEEEPHQAVDYIMYRLAVHLKIETVMFIRTSFDSRMFPVNIFEEGSSIIKEAYQKKISNIKSEVISFSDDIRSFLNKLNGNYEEVRLIQLYDQVDKINEIQTNKVSTSIAKYLILFIKLFNLLKFTKRFKAILDLRSTDVNSDQKVKGKSFKDSWSTKKQTALLNRRTFNRKMMLKRYYESLANSNISLDQPYIICALSYQPEKTTSPMGGHFVNQRLMVELLRNAMPPEWKLYVKDHISQFSWYTGFGEQHRSKDFYDQIEALPNTELVPLFYDTFSLIDYCKAVATITGSIGFEAIVRNKPVLIFGHPWYKFCEGVFYTTDFPILSEKINSIKNGFEPDIHKVNLFIQTIQENTFEGVVGGKTITSHAGEKGDPGRNSEAHIKSIISISDHNEEHKNYTKA